MVKIAGTAVYANTSYHLTEKSDYQNWLLDRRIELCLAGCQYLYGDGLTPDLTRHIQQEYRQLLINDHSKGLKNTKDIQAAAEKMQECKVGRDKSLRTHAYIKCTSSADLESQITSILIVGFSRGGVTPFLLMNMLRKYKCDLPIKIIADEPVPGTPTALRTYLDLQHLKNLERVQLHIALTGGVELTARTFSSVIQRGIRNLEKDTSTISLMKPAADLLKKRPAVFDIIMRVVAPFWAPFFTVFFRQQIPELSQNTPVNIIPKPNIGHCTSYTYEQHDGAVYSSERKVPYPWELQYTRGISRAALFALMQIGMSKTAQDPMDDAVKKFKQLCWSLKKLCPYNSRLRAFVEVMQYRADLYEITDDGRNKNINLLHQAFQLSCPRRIAAVNELITPYKNGEAIPALPEGTNKDDFFVRYHILNEHHGSKTLTTASALSTAVFSIAALIMVGMCFSQLGIASVLPILMIASAACAAAGLVSLVTATGAGIFHHCQLKKQAQLLADNTSGVSAQN